ncbi:hypothetical protein HBZC1_16820 [Helicobacter bizzozeronii CIII-1]|uniref:Uncharacterized protein n=1 Tax=Helicobacter bizzozeronii (strain CIII-1) TaxID=1002804 RepID=F8KPE4_HELBC|nr:hypothetical protein HBZC1_16820 [Helicobacter bizzozeronii CIII-1]
MYLVFGGDDRVYRTDSIQGSRVAHNKDECANHANELRALIAHV